MNKSVEIKELARHFYELFCCRYISIELIDKAKDMEEPIGVAVIGSDRPMKYKEIVHGRWCGDTENCVNIYLHLVDTTGEYSTNGEIDWSKCLFDFG